MSCLKTVAFCFRENAASGQLEGWVMLTCVQEFLVVTNGHHVVEFVQSPDCATERPQVSAP